MNVNIDLLLVFAVLSLGNIGLWVCLEWEAKRLRGGWWYWTKLIGRSIAFTCVPFFGQAGAIVWLALLALATVYLPVQAALIAIGERTQNRGTAHG